MRTPADVTDAELTVLEVLWDREQATRRQIADALYPGGNPAHYTTVQKLLERLQAKGYVRRLRRDVGLVFTARIDRAELINRRLRAVADKLCGGSLTPLLMNLARAQPLSAAELDDLRRLVQELTRQRKPREKPR